MVKDKEDDMDIYKISINVPINKKKIIIMFFIFLIIIGLFIIVENSINLIKQHKVYEQYQVQLATLQQQEKEKQIELEKKRQEKIPKLTQQR